MLENFKKPWSAEEDVLLINEYQNTSVPVLARKMGRTERSLRKRASILGIRKLTSWTEQEDDFIRENYLNRSPKELSKILGRTVKIIRNRAYCLGATYETKRFSDNEINYIIRTYGYASIENIALALDRSYSSIANKAVMLGLTKKRIVPGKIYRLILNENQLFEVVNLHEFIRSHSCLFDSKDVVWKPRNNGLPWCHASRGLGGVMSGRSSAWKGWKQA